MWHNIQTQYADVLTKPDAPNPKYMVGSAARLNVYRNNVAVSLNEALGQSFPVVKQLVGEDFFAGMAQAYIRQNKPHSPVLFEFGETFADFIKQFSPAESIPYLADIAALEFAWLAAYHASDADPLIIDVLSDIAEPELDDLTFKMPPSFSLLCSPWPVASIWQAHQVNDDVDLSMLAATAENVLINRPRMDVKISTLTPSAYRFAATLEGGVPLGQACAELDDIDGFDPAQHLGELFLSGAIIGMHNKNEK